MPLIWSPNGTWMIVNCVGRLVAELFSGMVAAAVPVRLALFRFRLPLTVSSADGSGLATDGSSLLSVALNVVALFHVSVPARPVVLLVSTPVLLATLTGLKSPGDTTPPNAVVVTWPTVP